MPSEPSLEIALVEPWMFHGMAALRVLEYGGDVDKMEARLRHLFESSFSQANGSIALATIAGNRVVGMQTYSPWPYLHQGKRFASLQSGATLVHPDFRGKRLFQRMLEKGTELARARAADFFMGFPVPMSYRGFLKDGWDDIGKLRWWTRPLHPLKLLRQRRKGLPAGVIATSAEPLLPERLASFPANESRFCLADDRDFLRWRYGTGSKETHYFEHGSGRNRVGVTWRVATDHGFVEALVGKIRANSASSVSMTRALRAFCRSSSCQGITAVSTALVNASTETRSALLLSGFVPTKASTPLIVKNLAADERALDRKLWRDISLEDVDVW